MPNARYNELQQRILPGGEGGARFIPPDEYKEFLQLGHGGVFDWILTTSMSLPGDAVELNSIPISIMVSQNDLGDCT